MNKFSGLLVVLLVYAAALVTTWLLYPWFKGYHPLLTAAILDLIATVVVFIFSMIFNNSSVYDPYWSVAPIPILLYWMMGSEGWQSPVAWIIFILVCIWGTRLTLNWVRRWKGMKDEDWRYADFRKQFPSMYWPISFLGIHLFPTILVFLGCMAVYPAITASYAGFSFNEVIAIVITLFAITMELVSDEQLVAYLKKRTNPDEFINTGLWKLSRHPNYFGEVTFWIGLSVFSMQASTFQYWVLAGPVAMILLFTFISVPMIDKRMLSRKPAYAEFISKSSGLIPWVPGKKLFP